MAVVNNIGSTLTTRAFLSPELEGFAGNGYRYTFRQVNNRVNQLAWFLKEQHLRPGERIAILCRNNQHFTTMFYAAAKTGAITVPLNWRLSASELSWILNDCQASFLLYDAEFRHLIQELRIKPPVRIFVRVGGTADDVEFEEALSGHKVEEPTLICGEDDPAVIMYTSGTTGKPKGAILTHNNLLWASVGLTYTTDWRIGDRFLSVAPLFHIGGLAPIVANIHKGCTTVFLPDFEPVKTWQLIEGENINFMMTVPFMLAAMLQVAKKTGADLPTLRFIVCGGSSVPESLINAYAKIGIKVYQVYGITENTGAVSLWTEHMKLEKCTSMGKPVFHGHVKIIDWETGAELPPGQVGEILCKGPQVFKGYWNNPAASLEALANGWYHSGDLGKKDEDGFIYVVDRIKEMIVSGGENIYPAELEMVIRNHPAVAEVAVTGLPDSMWGEIPVAFVIKKPGANLDSTEVFDLCKESLGKYKCIKKVYFVEELPRNAAGKIMKNNLKAQFLTQRPLSSPITER